MKVKVLFTKSRIIAISGLGLCIFGIIFLNFILPPIIKSQVKKKTALKDGWPMRNTWSKFPFPIEYRIHVFNVTNPDEVDKGEKPVLKEFGPYVYDAWQEKLNIIDHEEDDTLSYTTKHTYVFNSAKSNGLSDEDEYMLANFFILCTARQIHIQRATVLPLISRSIDSLMDKPKSVFTKTKIKTYLFDGYLLDCKGVEEFFGKVVCNELKATWYDNHVVEVRDDLYSSSAWGSVNVTTLWIGETRIRRGIRNINEVGELVEYNRTNNYGKWNNDKCDAFAGTDGFSFRPFLTKKDTLYVSNTYFCRTFPYQYDSTVKYKGLKLLRFTTSLATYMDTNPDDKCYCLSQDQCLKSGVYELTKCLSWVLVASNPHFYLADPYYTNAVLGLEPNKEKHLSHLDVDPLTGIVVRANFRVQMSAPVNNLTKFRLMKNFPTAVLPLTFTEIRTVLPDFLVSYVKKVHTTVKIEKIISYLPIISGLLMFVSAVGYEIKQKLSSPAEVTLKTTEMKVQIDQVSKVSTGTVREVQPAISKIQRGTDE